MPLAIIAHQKRLAASPNAMTEMTPAAHPVAHAEHGEAYA